MQRRDDQALLLRSDGLSSHQRAEISNEGMHVNLSLFELLVYLLLVVYYLLLIDLGDERCLLTRNIS